MGERNADVEPTSLLGDPGGESMQLNRWPAFSVAGYLDLTPPDSPGPWECLDRLVHSLFGCNSRGRMTGGVRPTRQIVALTLGEKPSHRLLPLVGQEPADALEIHQVDSNAHDPHKRDHQKSATPRRADGTGR